MKKTKDDIRQEQCYLPLDYDWGNGVIRASHLAAFKKTAELASFCPTINATQEQVEVTSSENVICIQEFVVGKQKDQTRQHEEKVTRWLLQYAEELDW